MSNERKRGGFNERVKLAHERKDWVEENRRIERMERDADTATTQKRKRSEVKELLAFAAGLSGAAVTMPAGLQFGFAV